MSYIEFVGPPGAGKSTLLKELLKREEFYGGIKEDAIRRWMITEAESKYRIPFRITPSFIRSFFEQEFIEYRLRHRLFSEFVQHSPNYLNMLSLILERVDYESYDSFRKSRKMAENYQIGIETVYNYEKLCIHGGFSLEAIKILWRSQNNSFPISDYFEIVPTPSLLVHVTAPVDVCVRRQRNRDSIAVSKHWLSNDIHKSQREFHNICQQVINEAEKNTQILTIKNTGEVSNTVDDIITASKKNSISEMTN